MPLLSFSVIKSDTLHKYPLIRYQLSVPSPTKSQNKTDRHHKIVYQNLLIIHRGRERRNASTQALHFACKINININQLIFFFVY